MRLINSETLELEDIIGRAEPYAILSHTWEYGEVSYQDFLLSGTRKKPGFNKIKRACEQAQKDGLAYTWVDTCCIDKTSSADLSEAINSMFKWYRDAVVCYAYLSDVPSDDNPTAAKSKFSMSRWFTRGWTLQELIAPRELRFYSSDWAKLGDKQSLTALLHSITHINVEVLEGKADLQSISVAERMSWAAWRQTTREEDMAYCLMGVFNVNMPMLYGEGPKAFLRLQEEILKESEDHSLFAWRASRASAGAAPYRGLFADSPAEFAGCKGIVPFRSLSVSRLPLNITNRGVPLTSHLEVQEGIPLPIVRASLNCRWGDNFQSVIAIELVSQGGDQFFRRKPEALFRCSSYGSQETIYVVKSAHTAFVALCPDMERQNAFYIGQLLTGMNVVSVFPASVPYSPVLGLIKLGEWIVDKAVVQLSWANESECLLVALWATLKPPLQTCECVFDVVVAPWGTSQPNAAICDRVFGQFGKPNEPMEEKVVYLKSGRCPVIVRVKPGKVQGFDMFILEVKPHPGNPYTNAESFLT